MTTIFLDLMLDNGELVRVKCPTKHEDDLYESLEHAMKRGDWWSPNQFDGCRAEYMGTKLDRVAMKRVVGTL